MTQQELKQAAMDYLAKAFTSPEKEVPQSHMIQSAVAIVLTPMPLTEQK